MSYPEEPMTRQEQYLDAIARGETDGMPAVPNTRMEMYLDAIARNGGGGGGAVVAKKYDDTKPYAVGEHVINAGKLYVKTSGGTVAEAWDPTHWTEVTVGEELTALNSSIAEKLPDINKYDGERLNDVFADADALCSAIETGDFGKMSVGDYWEFILDGTYRDYGTFTLLAGGTYYTDEECTIVDGTVSVDTVVSIVLSRYTGSFTVSGKGKRYCKCEDLRKWTEKTLVNSVIKAEIAGINAYWGYGDSGALAQMENHVCFVSRDCFGNAISMRPAPEMWVDESMESFTATGTTGTYTLSESSAKIRNVYVNRVLKTSGVTVSGASVTLAAGAGAVAGDTIIITYTDSDFMWTHSAVYKTLNDEQYGILKLLKSSDAKLFSHMIDMRYECIKCSYGALTKSSFDNGWQNRGKLFLPTETEVYNTKIWSNMYNTSYLPILDIFASVKKRIKFASDGAGVRAEWYMDSYNSMACFVFQAANGYTFITYSNQHSTKGVPLCFVLA